MSTPLIIIGGGEHARVVADAARTTSAYSLLGFVDPEPCDETVARGTMRRLGEDTALDDFPGVMAVLGVGPKPHGSEREETVRRLAARVGGWAPVVHARAAVSPDAKIGDGAVIMAGAIVQPGACIGRHAVVNSGAVVEHDVVLGDFVHVAPGAVLGGGVVVGGGTYIGLGAAVRDHVTVGARAVVGMGAVVVADVADETEVRGVPARAAVPRGAARSRGRGQ